MLYKGVQRESAKAKAIRIPELLYAILLELCNEWREDADPTILKCVLVNQSWESESNRLLWEYCGENDIEGSSPLARHLVAIGKDRRQKYANYIRVLWLWNEYDNGQWEGRFHAELASLSFPVLRNLTIGCFHQSRNDRYTPIKVPIPYSQPLLETLKISCEEIDGVVICDEFLLALSSQSKSLKHLDLCISSHLVTASVQGVSKFFRDMTALTHLTIGPDSIESMSSETFLNLSRMPSLLQLEIAEIQSDWTEGLGLEAFTALQSLTCRIDSNGLEKLLKLTPGLLELSLRTTATSTDILSIIAQAKLVRLVQLEFTPCPGTRINVCDLFSIADNATEMHSLQIPHFRKRDVDSKVTIDDLDDAKLSALAGRLPKLSMFKLVFEDSRLTNKSLVSLGTQCPGLSRCSLAAIISHERLIQEAVLGTFANLRYLKTSRKDENDIETMEPGDVLSMGKAALKLMPKLHYLGFHTDRI